VTNEQDYDSMKLMETIQGGFDHLIRENPMGEARKDALKLDFWMVLPARYAELAGIILKLR